ncbi:MAG: glycosyltransferase [Armatimonadetes bacterium]|nr:glycosyltransferase [Armatimonadota bacterium]
MFLDHSAQWSGGEISLFNLVTHLNQEKWKPLVVLFEDGPLYSKLLEAGIETKLILLDPRVSKKRKDTLGAKSVLRLRELRVICRFCYRLARLMRREKATIVHCNSLKADILGGIAGKMARVPVIWHVRDRIADDYLPRPVVFGFRWAARLLGVTVIAVSNAVGKTLHFPQTTQPSLFKKVIYNGVVVHDGLSSPHLLKGETTATIGMVGRISPWKGQHIFIEAAARVHQRFPQYHFQIIGSTLFGEEEYEKQIRAQAVQLELENVLEWTGFRGDINQLLHEMEVFVHASTTGEPFGQVIVEAMLAGKPVVATNGGGVPEIVQEGQTGLLVPMNDAQSMAEAIIWLIENPEKGRQLGQAGRARALEHFSIQKTAEKIEGIYSELLKDR